MTVKTTGFEETQKIGEELAKKLKAGDVVLLYGQLGAGKTTFVQGVAKGLGVNQKIVSPTYILIRRYETRNSKPETRNSKLETRNTKAEIRNSKFKIPALPAGRRNLKTEFMWHVDLYRLEGVEEINGLGIKEIIDEPQGVVLIEWPEKIENLLPKKRIEVKIVSLSPEEREITITGL